MRTELAERLLAKVMAWTAEELAQEMSFLQAMAKVKYDEYQNYLHGMRFIESLAVWLNQFKNINERKIAYEFVKKQLIFISFNELLHLVSIVYKDRIKKIILSNVIEENNDFSPYFYQRVSRSKEFEIMKRKSLFLGLSDGARIDYFRRFSRELSHEQIWPIYDFSSKKAKNMKKQLFEDLRVISGKNIEFNDCKFKNVFLLDDFSASGLSYIRMNSDGTYKGKIYSFLEKIYSEDENFTELFEEQFNLYIILYIGTEKAVKHIETLLENSPFKLNKIGVYAIQMLTEDIRINQDNNNLSKLIDTYYDQAIEDQHTLVGGTKNVKYGFAGCGLPVVLHHNTPNNSIALLWSYEELEFRGLFPRIKRH